MNDKTNKLWMWGYTLKEVPGPMRAMDGLTSCSLETGAHSLGCDNLMWMDTLENLDEPSEQTYQYLKDFKRIICGLTHIETNGPGLGGWETHYEESARNIGKFSRRHPNVVGALLDDFLAVTGPSKDMTPKELERVYHALKEENPEAKMYIVIYHKIQDPKVLLPYADFFDGASIWNWSSTDYFWDYYYDRDIENFKKLFPDKELIQGQYIHDFSKDEPQPLDQLEKQCEHIIRQLDCGNLDGWCILQNSHLDKLSHRRQWNLINEYWTWYRSTHTVR